jgi:hypothetical protein
MSEQTTHSCDTTTRIATIIRRVNYGDRVMWEMVDSSHSPTFDIHFCPFCGARL